MAKCKMKTEYGVQPWTLVMLSLLSGTFGVGVALPD
jgi:hypothetical protein